MSGSTTVQDWLHSWNPAWDDAAVLAERLRRVRIEDDVREALQNVRAHRPSPEQRRQLLQLSAELGVEVSFLGFPAASAAEQALCAELVAYIAAQALPLTPALMARAVPGDLHAVLDIQQHTGVAVTADLYLSTSPIRARVEGWDLRDMLTRLTAVARLAAAEGLAFRIAFEDSTRTPPHDLAVCVAAALDAGARCIVLNDTTGDCLPAGAAAHTRFIKDLISRSGADVELSWHGHNDKGLALANSLAAIQAGAELISGTFTGLGERTGNLALEQLLVILTEAGSTRYDLRQLAPMCALIASCTQVPIPDRQPIIGADAFSTATGTHAAALLKARQLGPDFEDAIYSAVNATAVGRTQTLLIGPNSGRAGVHAALHGMGLPSDPETVGAVLTYCKDQDRTLFTTAEVRAALPFAAAGRGDSAAAAAGQGGAQ